MHMKIIRKIFSFKLWLEKWGLMLFQNYRLKCDYDERSNEEVLKIFEQDNLTISCII